jgi:hypothetical protein
MPDDTTRVTGYDFPDRLQNDTRTIPELIAEDRTATHDYMARQRQSTEYWLDRGDRCFLANRKLKSKRLSHDGKVRTLADFGAGIGETYNTVRLLIKLSKYRPWIESYLETEEAKALDAGQSWEPPYWKRLLKIAKENDPNVLKKVPRDRVVSDNAMRIKVLEAENRALKDHISIIAGDAWLATVVDLGDAVQAWLKSLPPPSPAYTTKMIVSGLSAIWGRTDITLRDQFIRITSNFLKTHNRTPSWHPEKVDGRYPPIFNDALTVVYLGNQGGEVWTIATKERRL